MSTKYFRWDGGAQEAVSDLRYPEGTPVEAMAFNTPTLAVQAWHALTREQRDTLIARLTAKGWIEGEQSKPDEPG